MSLVDKFKDAERILRELESETVQRLQAAEGAADAPRMNSAVGRLTYMDAYQQQKMALHAQRNLESQLAAIRSVLQRVQKGTDG